MRGLKAPPRRTCAPACLTAAAVSRSCSSDSIAHGPAITTGRPAPTLIPYPRSTTVSLSRTSRLASL